MADDSLIIRVQGEITIPLANIPPMALEQIKSALTIANEEKAKAAELKQFGWWDMPDTVALWRLETRRGGEQVLCLPRGFASALVAGLTGLGITATWDDQRSRVSAAADYYQIFEARDYQVDAVIAMLKHEQGIWKASAGAGKTVGLLLAMAYSNQRALVIVDRAGLVEQWRARAAAFFGFPTELGEDGQVVVPLKGERTVGKIGQGVWEERDLTVCLRQTLHERAWQLDATSWWATWGMTVYDEVHHVSSDTLAELTRKTVSAWMLGSSATPAKSPMKAAMVHALVGPIIHETPRQTLYDRGVLVRPVIEVVRGDFYAHFHPDHDSDDEGFCQMEGCRKKKKHSHRNNYSTVLKKLVEDDARNTRIANRIMQERGHHHLVASSQLKHLNLIRRALLDAGWPEDKLWYLRGEENSKGLDQQIVQEVAAAEEAVVLSTVAGEALDIPPIDRVHVVFPMRDAGATIQLVGRCERTSPPRKIDAIVVDYREPMVDVFEGQWGERDRTYRMQGYEIQYGSSSDQPSAVAG